MTLLACIDNEVANFGEWTSRTQSGSSTIVQSSAAAWPQRGSIGLHVVAASGNYAYVMRNIAASIAAGGDLFIGFWYCLRAIGSSGVSGIVYSSGMLLYQHANRPLLCYFSRDTGNSVGVTTTTTLSLNRWYYVVLRLHRAATSTSADGYGQIYIDGVSNGKTANIDNYDTVETTPSIQFGATTYSTVAMTADFDEIKISTMLADVEPYATEPLSDYPEAGRTVVLFRQASDDSRAFADYCVEKLGVPQANLCPLPNASADETLTSYATFQTQVENDLAAWLAGRPIVASRVTTFLLGYGVPGYFTHNGVKHSAASRLMHYGSTFSSQTANPLYKTQNRLTASGLRSAGVYLATHIDADTLVNAKAVLDNGLALAALAQETDALYHSDSTYRASLDCQHLRLPVGEIPTAAANAAFVAGDLNSLYGLATSGTRVGVVCHSQSAATLRSADNWVSKALLSNGFAIGMGFSAAPAAALWDSQTFFELLRARASFAEAACFASTYVDYTTVLAGCPTAAVEFPQAGYNVYQGPVDQLGGVEGIDWDNPVAYLQPGSQQFSLTLSDGLSSRRVFAARRVSAYGVEERNTYVLAAAEADESGQLLSAAPAPVTDLSATVLPDRSVLVEFTRGYCAGCPTAESFEVCTDDGSGIVDLENPAVTVSVASQDQVDFHAAVTPASLPARFAVRAVSAGRGGTWSYVVAAAAAAPQTAILL